MTYPSDTLAFNKAEILRVLQLIDENFDLGEISNDVASQDSLEPIKIHNPFNDYRKFLFNTQLLSLWESACIACNIDSAVLNQMNEDDLREKYPELNSAVTMLNSSIKIGSLPYHDYEISKQDLQKILLDQGIDIIGFNKNADNNSTLSTFEKENQELKAEINKLKDELKNIASCNDSQFGNASLGFSSVEDYQRQRDKLLIENKKLKDDLVKSNQMMERLKDQFIQTEQSNLLELINDESAENRYAPDLILAIKLWKYLYIENRIDNIQSHSNMAQHWLNKNTSYIDSETGGEASKERIRAVVTPFADWGAKRNKKYKK